MKLFATDLDGTLLNEKHEVSQENAEAIRKAQAHGIEIVVATGRSFNAARKPLDAVGLDCPVICLNGAKVHDKDGKVTSTIPLDKAMCHKIKNACQNEGIYFEVFTNEGGFSSSREKFLEVMIDIAISAYPDLDEDMVRERGKQRFQDEDIQVTNDFQALFARNDIDVYKILAFSIVEGELINVNRQLQSETGIAITSSGDSNLEFNHPDAQKGIALKLFAAERGIEMKDVMAIGDNYNDVSMLKMAGRGVAMGNSDEAIKKVCNYSTKSNSEHGVAYAIEEMLEEIYQ
ncbi:Cof-type HAD-IIB family hydrolase [Aquibacillus rhizosphaerae]|uniref:Cof-type HAD-IIB family hydrolase n=1 Tax=Aquibacillus rhizosphaerae TaxID=3051431 RepID=A0ABT7LB12_9BACI|nr:Cof-type HAD-IIB family hydrolase [Aquibacillus sp. LR5S19]MDL4843038.1 Cof-type HAD-IIB family hydrolase [Aquibacillus sp. LR5S19]